MNVAGVLRACSEPTGHSPGLVASRVEGVGEGQRQTLKAAHVYFIGGKSGSSIEGVVVGERGVGKSA